MEKPANELKLQKIEGRAAALSKLVNTKDGMATIDKLFQICRNLAEGTASKPNLESSEDNPLATERNKRAIQVYEEMIDRRINELMRGDRTTNLEQDLYLQSIGISTMSTSDPNITRVRASSLQEFDRQRKDIYFALLYKNDPKTFLSEIFDSQIATKRSLERDGVSREAAINAFENSWVSAQPSANQDPLQS